MTGSRRATLVVVRDDWLSDAHGGRSEQFVVDRHGECKCVWRDSGGWTSDRYWVDDAAVAPKGNGVVRARQERKRSCWRHSRRAGCEGFGRTLPPSAAVYSFPEVSRTNRSRQGGEFSVSITGRELGVFWLPRYGGIIRGIIISVVHDGQTARKVYHGRKETVQTIADASRLKRRD